MSVATINGSMCTVHIDVRNAPITYISISSNVASAGSRPVIDADGTGFDTIKNSEFIRAIELYLEGFQPKIG